MSLAGRVLDEISEVVGIHSTSSSSLLLFTLSLFPIAPSLSPFFSLVSFSLSLSTSYFLLSLLSILIFCSLQASLLSHNGRVTGIHAHLNSASFIAMLLTSRRRMKNLQAVLSLEVATQSFFLSLFLILHLFLFFSLSLFLTPNLSYLPRRPFPLPPPPPLSPPTLASLSSCLSSCLAGETPSTSARSRACGARAS